MNKLNRLNKSRGQSLVELSMTLPILLILVFGIAGVASMLFMLGGAL